MEEHSNTQRTPYLFTAKELDEETGLYYFGARYYDPRTSVWQSPDPILAKYLPSLDQTATDINELPSQGGIFEPVNLNLYACSHQRPLVMGDPNGKNAKWYTTLAGEAAHRRFGAIATTSLQSTGRYQDIQVNTPLSRIVGAVLTQDLGGLTRPDVAATRIGGRDIDVWELKPISWSNTPESRQAAAAQLDGYINSVNNNRGLFSRPRWAQRGDNDLIVEFDGMPAGQITANGTIYDVRLWTGRNRGIEQEGVIYYDLTPVGRTIPGQIADGIARGVDEFGRALQNGPIIVPCPPFCGGGPIRE